VLKFTSEQKVYSIGGTRLGGQPGQYPTVLIGSIFFAGHRIVRDPVKGLFDKGRAADLLALEEECAVATGNPHFVDVVGETTDALTRYLEFVAAHTAVPLLVDSPSQRVRMETVRRFAGTEVMPRLVYNAIAEDYTDEELACLKECGIENAIVLAFSTKAMKPAARLGLLTERLLPAVRKAGIRNVLIDTGVLDMSSVSLAALAISEVRERLGYPAGCAPANALYTWQRDREHDEATFRSVATAVFALTQSKGANFVFYGSLAMAPWVYPAVAAADALIAYGGRFCGVKPLTSEHPLYKVF